MAKTSELLINVVTFDEPKLLAARAKKKWHEVGLLRVLWGSVDPKTSGEQAGPNPILLSVRNKEILYVRFLF